uniref:hypothetical protein n=1 Tax=uncultured Piscinibacter sp. TaxID=1131835 RepID=UPI002615D95B
KGGKGVSASDLSAFSGVSEGDPKKGGKGGKGVSASDLSAFSGVSATSVAGSPHARSDFSPPPFQPSNQGTAEAVPPDREHASTRAGTGQREPAASAATAVGTLADEPGRLPSDGGTADPVAVSSDSDPSVDGQTASSRGLPSWAEFLALAADDVAGDPNAWKSRQAGKLGAVRATYGTLAGVFGQHCNDDIAAAIETWKCFVADKRAATFAESGEPLWSGVTENNVVRTARRWLKDSPLAKPKVRRPLNLDQPNGPMDDILRRLPPRRGPLNLDQPYTEYDEMVRNPHYRRLVQREGGN